MTDSNTEKQDRPIASWQPAFFDLTEDSTPIIPEMPERYPVAEALQAKLDRKHADAEALTHCYKKVMEIVDGPTPTPKAIMQLGYNLGRISEITGEGREIWDTTKGWVEQGLWTVLYYWAEPRLIALESGVKC